MVYLRNLLAANEIHVAHYYLSRDAFVAAANRGRYVVENFQGTPSVGDGLAVMTEAYQHMGLTDLSQTTLQTLKLNYPDHPSLSDGEFVPREREADSRSWLARATLGMIETEVPAPDRSQANEDVYRQYQRAQQELPREIDAGTAPNAGNGERQGRSWWSRLTFGLFD